MGAKGRAKGEKRNLKPWLGDMTLPQVLDYLREHPKEIIRKENAYMQQKREKYRERKSQSPREENSVVARAKKNFRKYVRLQLRKEGIE